jgi:hypothetical protein
MRLPLFPVRSLSRPDTGGGVRACRGVLRRDASAPRASSKHGLQLSVFWVPQPNK